MKKINIDLVVPMGEIKRVTEKEYPYIGLDAEINDEDLNRAIDVIITAFMQRELYKITIDLDERNRSMMPSREMTIEEIEKQLGCKVKIVNEKEII